MMLQYYKISIPLLDSKLSEFSGILSLDGKGFQIKEQIASQGGISLWQAILFALIGGLDLQFDAMRFSSYLIESFKFCFDGWG